jgi:hypothetical protein
MLKNLFLASCATVFGLVAVEGAYRAYLYFWHPYYFQGDQGFWYLQSSPVAYNEAFGFDYVPGTYQGGYVYDGQVIECWNPVSWWVINERGNSGRIAGDYDDASLKVLAFGDSFTQRPMQGPNGEWMTWPNYLQDILERELGQSVHVVNFGRDGYGILQMFDLAAAKVVEWKPDLAIIAFITDDLDRGRFWRTNSSRDGEERVLISELPDPDPGWDIATDAFLVHSGATGDWCQEMLQTQRRDDRVIRELEDRLVEGRRRSSVLASPWSLRQSFVFDVTVHGEPLHSTYSRIGPTQMPRHELHRFSEDSLIVARVEQLRGTGVPYVLIHLASSTELEQGLEFGGSGRTSRQRMSLLSSLEELTGKEVYGTLDHVDLSGKGSEELDAYYDRDGHPSLLGHEFYSGVVSEILLSDGLIP